MVWRWSLGLGILLFLAYCNASEQSSETVAAQGAEGFLNLHDTVDYVGMATCRNCHNNIHETYIHTGMGQSFADATPQKSKASFGQHALVYDEQNDYYYHPYFEDSSMYILEFRLEGKDTVHRRLERIDYIIGSGHHTNSHLINRNGYVYQAPITFYTQEKRWDLAPGFEEVNERFGRLIATECLTCHNHFPQHVAGSENKYLSMPQGIECERCHGPGELHVQQKMAGNIVDTSKYTDYSIVNPSNLPIDLQMDLCQRCHLQGIAVLNPGKSFYDFRPGMQLADVMNVYLPRFTNSHERFIMASQADRLRMSQCFTESQQLSCITCHNPHHDVQSQTANNYNGSCQSCHQKGSVKSKLEDCSAPKAERLAVQDNCVECHMPPSSSIDIPHISITDHYISRDNIKGRKISKEESDEVARFLGLRNLTKENPSDLEMAAAYLALYDKFMREPYVLDSAQYYLQRSKAPAAERLPTEVHYAFTRLDYNRLLQLAQGLQPTAIQEGWTAYRIAEAFAQRQQLNRAQAFYERALELRPYNLDFREKLGVVYARQQRIAKARSAFEWVLKEDAARPLALANLGLTYALERNWNKALELYDKALAYDPDYANALLNKVGVLVQIRRVAEAKQLLQRCLKKHPSNQRALQMQQALKRLG